MAFLDYNLARMGSIGRGVEGIASRAAAAEEARKQRKYGAIQTGIGVYGEQKQREFQSSEAGKIAQAKVLEAGKGRAFDWGTADVKARALKASEDRMYEQYEDGSYKDDLTGIDYKWDNQPEFQMQLAKMKADRDRHLAKLSAGDKEEGADIYGAFRNTLDELSMIFPAGGLNPATLMYDTDWMLENKEDFMSAFNEFVSSKYSTEEQASLNRLLEQYLNSYEIGEEEEPVAAGGFEWPWKRATGEYDPTYPITGGYGPDTGARPLDIGPIEPGETVTGGYYTAPPKDKEIRKDFYDTLSGIQTAKPPVHIGESPQWDQMMRLLLSLPQDLTSDQMMEIDKRMERAESGRISRSELDDFLTFLKQMSPVQRSFSVQGR